MSPLPVELLLALRYLRPKRTFVSVITLISVMGVMLGVAVMIIVISVMTGFDRQLRERILGFNAHLRVMRDGGALSNYVAAIRTVSSNAHVRGAAPFVLGQVLVKTQPGAGNALVGAPWVRGIDPEYETRVSNLATSVFAGEFTVEGRSVLVGVEFARSLRLNVGDRLLIYSPRNLEEMEKARGTDREEAVLPEEFTVRGIFDVGYFEYNANVIVTSLENAQDLYQLDDQVHGLLVMVDDPFQAGAVRDELFLSLGGDHRITLWLEENSYILNALMVEKNVMFYILFFIMIVAAFGIMNSQITFVVQKTREIGMLKALGGTRGQIMGLFLGQSTIVGVVGVICGFGLGMLALAYRNEFLHFMNRMTGIELFPAAIYSFTELPAMIVPGDIALICGSALVVCVLAGLAPAWTAGRLQPVEALRHE
ncbi:MAG TPA: ABC transporter permease [Methylomirabilota bacterium]|nr:ABC transporter permease [Methylomirabilota bacterium]